jgi:hypothetical protein
LNSENPPPRFLKPEFAQQRPESILRREARVHQIALHLGPMLQAQCLFDAKIVERLNPETRQLFKKIGGVANNLNQAAHRANADGYPAASSELSQLATEISDMLTEARNA